LPAVFEGGRIIQQQSKAVMAEQLLKGSWSDLGSVLPVSYDGKPFRSAGQLPEKLFQGADSPSAVEGVARQQYEVGGGSIDCGQQVGV
jgi:hypothetical protein